MGRAGSRARAATPASRHYEDGLRLLRTHPVFEPLYERVRWVRNTFIHRSALIWPSDEWPADAWLWLGRDEHLYVHPKRLAEPEVWAHVMARGLLYHALELWQPDRGNWEAWSAACDVVTARFLQGIKFYRSPEGMTLPDDLPAWDEARWYRQFCEDGVPDWAAALSLAGRTRPTMQAPGDWPDRRADPFRVSWPEAFSAGIAESVRQAVEVVAGLRSSLGSELIASSGQGGRGELRALTRQARDWFISSFPLLGAMVASFEFVEDAGLCRREDILVAAVDESLRTIYLNPAVGLDEQESRFVIAHEVLHVALRHLPRRQGRDPWLWNVACDFVINDWLIQMQVGTPPALGLLFDEGLRGLSAEEIYDRIARDLRRMRKLRTLAGGQCDMLERRLDTRQVPFTDLDAFCREQLGKGLLLHQQQGRGYLPAGLIEEINALLQPPIPWEVQLARWFDHHFPPLETRRTYARLSRRQSATPDIPRPHLGVDESRRAGRTFGVVLDSSGSMSRQMLARALGAIASYAEAKEVAAVRVVFCDARPHDAGYLAAHDIAGRVRVHGRGGTVLQPGIDLLQDAADFPPDGPILIITDGQCDVLKIRRSHAFLMPPGAGLPFVPRGEVFRMTD
ncbi:MAG: VWA-like domain-containing protein [Lautropia sp.]|nr:VWA-like domain-containing protein [Lautropia sp.]